MYKLTPSIMTSDLLRMKDTMKTLIASGIDWVHFDLMDGKFVPNLGLCPDQLRALKKAFPELTIDAHCMVHDVKNVFFQIKVADYITVHLSSHQMDSMWDWIDFLNQENKKIGLAFDLIDDVNDLIPFLPHIDLITIMTIKPGFAGQSFEAKGWENIETIKKLIDKQERKILLQVDGGVRENNIKKLKDLGVDLIVVGSLIFHNNEISKNVEWIRKELDENKKKSC